jgi:hypothetical protein
MSCCPHDELPFSTTFHILVSNTVKRLNFNLPPWRWRQQIPLKYLYLSTELDGVISHMTVWSLITRLYKTAKFYKKFLKCLSTQWDVCLSGYNDCVCRPKLISCNHHIGFPLILHCDYGEHNTGRDSAQHFSFSPKHHMPPNKPYTTVIIVVTSQTHKHVCACAHVHTHACRVYNAASLIVSWITT